MTAHSVSREDSMSQLLNRYRADLRDHRFVLFEQFRITDVIGRPPFAAWGKEEIDAVLEQVYEVAQSLGAINAAGDAVGCRLEDGRVITPPGFQEAWRAVYRGGWRSLSVEERYGGQSGPFTLHSIAEEMMC